MSTTPPRSEINGAGVPVRAGVGHGTAERRLFERLFDDAAVFPPGLAPLDRAVTEHVNRRAESYADLVGPLLVSAGSAHELADLAGPATDRPVEIVLVARPGISLETVGAALDTLRPVEGVRVVGTEIGYDPRWAAALAYDLPLAVEVGPGDIGPSGDRPDAALAELAATQDEAVSLVAKLRTGATPTSPIPTAGQLARFIRGCVDASLSFKLTGGLHHAMPHESAQGTHESTQGTHDTEHGFLGVLAATRWALNGADVEEMSALIQQRDTEPILDLVTRMSQADASVVRAFFTGYGCCGVLDPIAELSALGLIAEDLR